MCAKRSWKPAGTGSEWPNRTVSPLPAPLCYDPSWSDYLGSRRYEFRPQMALPSSDSMVEQDDLVQRLKAVATARA